MQPLSILLISPDPRIPGGVSAFAATLKTHVKNSRMTSLSVGHAGGKWHWINAAGRLLSVSAKAVFLAWRRPIDVVHINPTFNARSLIRDGFILLALRLAGQRHIIMFFHGWDMQLEQRIRKWPAVQAILARTLKVASRIVVLAPEFKASLESMGLDSRKIILGRAMFDESVLNAHLSPPTRRSILFMSRFDRRKGMYELLDAFARIAPEFPDLDLVMAGDGEEAVALKARAASYGLQGRVVFPSYVVGQAKAQMLAACTLLALPTNYPEGMPIVLLEAMAAGKPVLTTNAGGIQHIVREPDNGIILEQVTPDAIATALRRMLNNPELCVTVGEYNALYARRFATAAVTAEIESLYQTVAHE